MHPRAEEFAGRARERYDVDVAVHEFDEGTKTAAAAAEAVGCDVAQIASSIALRAGEDLVVCVTSGANRVDVAAVAELRGVPESEVGMADAAVIRETLGWSIGGVPPFCHEADVPTYMDETLLDFEAVWAAAGTPEAVFPIDPERLRELSGARVVALAEA
ncbi:YbaK/EbsC family protein [Halomarina oriensis]|uniref:YbaK/EbsC family protein n=1 Tax=Halomarina oriensis TaxID=671145 RepID=A0A6B0GLT8_9EURY|nr:YbaK/EbsC family protein [Halomarina oriensis]MWG33095.1 YbaK/EbsC family protein [Halomarina oriensis]